MRMNTQFFHHAEKSTAVAAIAKPAQYESTIRALLAEAGVGVDGKRPFDLHVHDPRFYRRVLRQGSLGFGESYMDGWWDCDAIDALTTRLLQAGLDKPLAQYVFQGLIPATVRARNVERLRRVS
jgi:cyclopropane-fatty-acyl-phospholipid synthase